MSKGRREGIVLAAGAVVLAVCGYVFAQAKKDSGEPATRGVSAEKVLKYVREKFGIPENAVLTVDPFKSSPDPAFLASAIQLGVGKDKRTTNFLVSKDGQYVVLGSLQALNGNTAQSIEQQVRQAAKLPANVKLNVGPLHPSKFAGFEETTVSADDGRQKQSQQFFVTQDRRFLVMGRIFNLNIPPRVEALRGISLANQPSIGPSNAPVTIVEYADLECPTCARLHQMFENDLVPRYGNKIRIVFKEFPLVQIHDWALAGAVACQCAYEMNPAAFVTFRSLVFQHQSGITGLNARDALIQYGQEAGLDGAKLAGCLDTRATLPRVEANMQEGQALAISQTPTCFVNGKVVAGANPEDYYKAIDEALAARGGAPARPGQGGHATKPGKKS